MSELLHHAGHSLLATVCDVLPIAIVLAFFQRCVLRQPVADLRRVLIGVAYVILGLALFLVGLKTALFPLGESMARQLASPDLLQLDPSQLAGSAMQLWGAFVWAYLFALTIAFSTTIAEPALIALAIKANEVSAGGITVWGLRIAVALGVAFGVSLGTFRIVSGVPLPYFLLAGYAIILIQTKFAPPRIIPLAFDAGGVSSSTVTVPIVAALGVGLAENIHGRDPLIDGFGLVALAAFCSIIAVMGYAQLAHWRAGRRPAAEPRRASP